MKPRRRKTRAVIKWTGAVVTVLLLVVWVGSAWFGGGLANSPVTLIGVEAGQFIISWDKPLSLEQFGNAQLEYGPGPPRFHWWFEYVSDRSGTSWAAICIPVWSLVLLTAIPTSLLFRTDRRRALDAKLNLCRTCGYSRVGIPADRACPECGATTPSA